MSCPQSPLPQLYPLQAIADGICIESYNLTMDEASLTGEGDPIHKNPEQDPWVRSGTQVSCSPVLTSLSARARHVFNWLSLGHC